MSMDRDGFVGALRRQWWIVVVAFVLGFLVGAIPSPKRASDTATSYEATHTLLLTSNDPSGTVVSDTLNLNELQLLSTAGEVPKTVAAALGEPNSAVLVSQIQVSLDGNTNSLTISARATSADRAVAIADTFADELSKFVTTRQDDVREQRLTAASERLVTLQADVESLSKQVAQHPDDRILVAKLDAATRRYSSNFEEYDTLQGQPRVISLVTLESAQAVPVKSSGLRAPRSRGTRGLFLGIVAGALGLAAIFLLGVLDPRIRRRTQAEAILGVEARLTIPGAPRTTERRIAVRRDRHDPVADSYRALRSVLRLAHGRRADQSGAPVTLVLSAGAGDGKTTATGNLAAAFVESGSRTVAVNADFRRPTLAALLDADNLASVAPEALPDMPLVVSASVTGLRVYDERLPNDDASPSELARKVVRTLPWLTSHYEDVVIDSAPVASAAEVLELLPIADSIIVVVRLGHTRIESAVRTAETLRALGVEDFMLVIIGGAGRTGEAYEYGAEGIGSVANRTVAGDALRKLRDRTTQSRRPS